MMKLWFYDDDDDDDDLISRSKQRKQTMEAGGLRGSVSICNHLLPTGRPPVARQQFPDDNG